MIQKDKVPEAQWEMMRSMPKESKWTLIQQQQAELAVQRTSPLQYIEKVC